MADDEGVFLNGFIDRIFFLQRACRVPVHDVFRKVRFIGIHDGSGRNDQVIFVCVECLICSFGSFHIRVFTARGRVYQDRYGQKGCYQEFSRLFHVCHLALTSALYQYRKTYLPALDRKGVDDGLVTDVHVFGCLLSDGAATLKNVDVSVVFCLAVHAVGRI